MRHLVPVAKVGVSAALLAFVFARLDLSQVESHFRKLVPEVVAAFLALVALQTIVVAGMRLKLLLECVGHSQPLGRTARVELCGFFFEQVAFGFVGGDAMRLWLLHRIGIPVGAAFKALFLDRCLGFGALLALVWAGLYGLLGIFPAVEARLPLPALLAALLLSGALALTLLLFLPQRLRRYPLLNELRELAWLSVRQPRVRARVLGTFGLAAFTHLLNVLAFFLLARNLGLSVSLAQWFFIVPAALLVSMLPIAAGGWGVREGLFVLGLGALGVRPEEATAVSVLFGLGVLVVTLGGALVWLSNRGPRRAAH